MNESVRAPLQATDMDDFYRRSKRRETALAYNCIKRRIDNRLGLLMAVAFNSFFFIIDLLSSVRPTRFRARFFLFQRAINDSLIIIIIKIIIIKNNNTNNIYR